MRIDVNFLSNDKGMKNYVHQTFVTLISWMNNEDSITPWLNARSDSSYAKANIRVGARILKGRVQNIIMGYALHPITNIHIFTRHVVPNFPNFTIFQIKKKLCVRQLFNRKGEMHLFPNTGGFECPRCIRSDVTPVSYIVSGCVTWVSLIHDSQSMIHIIFLTSS